MSETKEQKKLDGRIRKAIADRMGETGHTCYSLSRALLEARINDRTAYRILRLGTDCRVSTLEAILEALGLEIRILPKNE